MDRQHLHTLGELLAWECGSGLYLLSPWAGYQQQPHTSRSGVGILNQASQFVLQFIYNNNIVPKLKQNPQLKFLPVITNFFCGGATCTYSALH